MARRTRRGERNGNDANDEASAGNTTEALGLRLATPNGELLSKYGLDDAKEGGAIVTNVTPRSPAAKAGLQAGDLITEIGKSPVANAQDAKDALAKSDSSKGIRLYVTSRDGSRDGEFKPRCA
jgi:serine protease Do